MSSAMATLSRRFFDDLRVIGSGVLTCLFLARAAGFAEEGCLVKALSSGFFAESCLEQRFSSKLALRLASRPGDKSLAGGSLRGTRIEVEPLSW